MSFINIQGLVDNISEKSTIYTPIIEAIVNSIEAIDQSKRTDGHIEVIIKKNSQIAAKFDRAAPNDKDILDSIEIHDNGIGFTKINRDSFDTLYGDQKSSIGGKGFGRFMFLKYFKNVAIDSIYKDTTRYFKRTFTFSGVGKTTLNFISNENNKPISAKDNHTIISLSQIKEQYSENLEKKIITIARILVEKLLPYFIDDNYKCPLITLKESGTEEEIILNDFYNKHKEITLAAVKMFNLEDKKRIYTFNVKILKIYFTKSPSSIILTAHNRAVTSEPLDSYIPEFKDDFVDKIKVEDNKEITKNYSIKAYVLGDYLNEHVSLERNDFDFPKDGTVLYPFSRREIESNVAKIVKNVFEHEVITRQVKKLDKIKDYIDTKAPWHKTYFNELDLTLIPYVFDEETIEGELQKQKFKMEKNIRTQVSQILKSETKDITIKVEQVSHQLTELGKSDLAHYVVLRRVVLDVLKSSLKWSKDKQYQKEKVIHNIIFPMNSDSDHLSYDKHNLWIIDERLNFNEYLASDKQINKKGERPDILIFDKAIAIREGDDFSNPITVFELKRPQREKYRGEDDPIVQIGKYVEQIRGGMFKSAETGRPIKATQNTPAYGFIVCDITEDIKEFCKRHQLTPSPDNQGYFGYHAGYRMYIQLISFDKLINDAELRNKIFFKKLKIN